MPAGAPKKPDDQKKVNKTYRAKPAVWEALAEAADEHQLPESNMLEVFITQGARGVLGTIPSTLDEQLTDARRAWALVKGVYVAMPKQKLTLKSSGEPESELDRAKLRLFEAGEALAAAINELQNAEVAALTDAERSDMADA